MTLSAVQMTPHTPHSFKALPYSSKFAGLPVNPCDGVWRDLPPGSRPGPPPAGDTGQVRMITWRKMETSEMSFSLLQAAPEHPGGGEAAAQGEGQGGGCIDRDLCLPLLFVIYE